MALKIGSIITSKVHQINLIHVGYSEGMTMILSAESPDQEDLEDQNFLEIYQSAMDLYGLIHARFIISPRGLAMMKDKYMLGSFGYCPRVLCER